MKIPTVESPSSSSEDDISSEPSSESPSEEMISSFSDDKSGLPDAGSPNTSKVDQPVVEEDVEESVVEEDVEESVVEEDIEESVVEEDLKESVVEEIPSEPPVNSHPVELPAEAELTAGKSEDYPIDEWPMSSGFLRDLFDATSGVHKIPQITAVQTSSFVPSSIPEEHEFQLRSTAAAEVEDLMEGVELSQPAETQATKGTGDLSDPEASGSEDVDMEDSQYEKDGKQHPACRRSFISAHLPIQCTPWPPNAHPKLKETRDFSGF